MSIMYIFKFSFMENTVDPHSVFKTFVILLSQPSPPEFLYKALAVLEIVLWTRDFFASAS